MKNHLYLSFLFLSLAFASCCSDPIPYVNITEIEARFEVNGHTVDSGIIQADTLVLYIIHKYNYIAAFKPCNHFPFVTSAHALSCPRDGEEGLKHKIDSIVFTTNIDMNGIAPGNSINPLIFYSDEHHSIELYQQALNVNDYWYHHANHFFITGKPGTPTPQVFTVTYYFSNGTSMLAHTGEIIWE